MANRNDRWLTSNRRAKAQLFYFWAQKGPKIQQLFIGLGFIKRTRKLLEGRSTMAKNRNKRKNRLAEMAVDSTVDHAPRDESQAMDTSETVAPSASVGGTLRTKKGRPMKRSKNVRKVKAIEKAISKSEKSLVKISKSESKTLRTKFAKTLYD